MSLNARQRAFVAAYAGNAAEAAVKAGYSPKWARKHASKLMRTNADVRAAIDEHENQRLVELGLSANGVLGELLRIARADVAQAFDEHGQLLPLKDMPEDVRRAIGGVELRSIGVEDDAEGGDRKAVVTLTKVKFWDKVAALEKLGKHLKLFTDKVEHSGSVTLEQAVGAAVVEPPK